MKVEFTSLFTLGDDYTAEVVGGASSAYKLDSVTQSVFLTVYDSAWVAGINSDGVQDFEGCPNDLVEDVPREITGLANCAGSDQASAGEIKYGFVDIDLDATPVTIIREDVNAGAGLDGTAENKRPNAKQMAFIYSKQ